MELNLMKHKGTQHNGLACDIKHKCTLRINGTKQKTSQYKNTLCIKCHKCCVSFFYCCAECRYAQCHYGECHYTECRHAHCHGTTFTHSLL